MRNTYAGQSSISWGMFLFSQALLLNHCDLIRCCSQHMIHSCSAPQRRIQSCVGARLHSKTSISFLTRFRLLESYIQLAFCHSSAFLSGLFFASHNFDRFTNTTCCAKCSYTEIVTGWKCTLLLLWWLGGWLRIKWRAKVNYCICEFCILYFYWIFLHLWFQVSALI